MAGKRIEMKPGKGQSVFGFGVGIIFCLIGLFVVMPTMGPFGILWTLVAVGITVSHGMNAFSDEGLPTHEIVIEEDEIADGRYDSADRYTGDDSYGGSREKGGRSVEERLEEAKRLHNLGLITGEEYEQKRKQILEDL